MAKYLDAHSVIYEPGQIPPLVTDVLVFGYSEITPSDQRFPLHLHHFHQMDVAVEGEIILTLENQAPICAKRGDAWLIPPLMWHRVDSTQDFRHAHFKLHISPRFWRLFGGTFHQFHLSSSLINCLKKNRRTHQIGCSHERPANPCHFITLFPSRGRPDAASICP